MSKPVKKAVLFSTGLGALGSGFGSAGAAIGGASGLSASKALDESATGDVSGLPPDPNSASEIKKRIADENNQLIADAKRKGKSANIFTSAYGLDNGPSVSKKVLLGA